MKLKSFAWAAGWGALLLCCKPLVVEPIDLGPAGGAASSTSSSVVMASSSSLASSSGGLGGGPAAINAIAVRNKDLPHPQTGPNFVPDMLVLFWSPLAETCAAPYGPSCPTEGWQFALFLPPELVQVGTVDLADSRVYTLYTFDPNGPPSCGSGLGEGWAFTKGTMNIVSLSASAIEVTFPSGVMQDVGDWSPPASAFAGTQTISLCQPLGDGGS